MTMFTCMLANGTYAIAVEHLPINRAYKPPKDKHVSQHASGRYETTLRADKLRDCSSCGMTNCMQHDMHQVPRPLRTFGMMAMAIWIAKSGA